MDAAIAALIAQAEAAVGPPSCALGCSACCQHSAPVTPPEAEKLLDFIAGLDASSLSTLRGRFAAQLEAPTLGPCPMLVNARCTAYAVRPGACRTQFVWHDARACDAPGVMACTPAELLEIRYLAFLDHLISEADAGRVPFWGELGLMLAVLERHGQHYRAGADLRERLDPRLCAEGGLKFAPGEDAVQRAGGLRARREQERERFANRPAPLGMPRILRATDRRSLQPIEMTALKR